jgi:hypothetical protein
MDLLYKRLCLSILIWFGFLISGCGEKPEGEVKIENFDTPPQVTIILHSQLELDYSLEPSSQLQTADGDKPVAGTKIDRMYASIKKKRRTQSGNLPEFKADTDYQAIKRYEKIDSQRYAITIKKTPALSRVRKTVQVQDKPLIFAGRGYNISAFEKEIKPAIDVDYSTHLVTIPLEPPSREIKDQLDPTTGYTRDTKNLVHNATRSARFGKPLPPLSENKSDPEIENKSEPLQVAKPALPLKRNRDSVLLFPREGESLLVLRKAKKQYDLLVGNESLNKKQFRASKVPETSNKIPSSLQ